MTNLSPPWQVNRTPLLQMSEVVIEAAETAAARERQIGDTLLVHIIYTICIRW